MAERISTEVRPVWLSEAGILAHEDYRDAGAKSVRRQKRQHRTSGFWYLKRQQPLSFQLVLFS